jgi:hypothetical protein
MEAPVSVVATAVPEESSATAVSWGPIIAGAVAAAAATLLLMLLGSGLGLTMVSPWSGESASLTTVAVSTAVWLVVVQWISACLAGYMAGRLRTKWVGVHTDEVFFRDTAHGFLAWALATLLVAGFMGSALTAITGAGAAAVTSVASSAVQGAATGTAANAAAPDATDMTSYFVDALFRPASAAAPDGANVPEAAATADAQASRILVAGAASGEMSAEDRTYLEQVVAARTGLPAAEAKARVDQVMQRVDAAKAQAKEAADTARKASATLALAGALSLVIGAFIAAASAALGGRLRDDEEAVFLSAK